MAIEGILEKINRNAEEKVSAIREEGRLKRREIISKAESQAKEIGDRILREAKQKAELERRRSSVSAELARRKEILKEKQKLMEDCFREALEELVNLPTEEYRPLIRKMLLKLVSSGDERILISSNDEQRIDQELIEGVNVDLKKAGKKGDLRFDGVSSSILGGFVLKTEEVEVNCSFGTLLAQLREELQSDVAGILFGEKK
ncbi:V-type ATP synthase subunit E [bacterium]|nr:V-type ATP synthase subunit E [bacterium]